jgi:hypothetical protein
MSNLDMNPLRTNLLSQITQGRDQANSINVKAFIDSKHLELVEWQNATRYLPAQAAAFYGS